MARKHKRHSTHRRRRVSGINKTDLTSLGLAVAGAVIASKVSAKLKVSTNTTMQNLAPYAGLIVGIGLPLMVKNPMVLKISMGIAIGGAIEALKKFAPGLVSGSYQLPVVAGPRRMNGGAYSQNQIGDRRFGINNDNLKIISGSAAMAAGMM